MSALDIQSGFYSARVFNSSWYSPRMNGLISVPGNNGAVSHVLPQRAQLELSQL